MIFSSTAVFKANSTMPVYYETVLSSTACQPYYVATHAKSVLGSQITDFFGKLFDTANWPPRWYSGKWSDFDGWLYVFSDLLIWASYFAISILLVRVLLRRKDIPFPKIIWLFMAFILLCGTTHFLDAILFWWPAYRLSALARLFTGIVSAITVYYLVRLMPVILSLRSVKDLEKEITDRRAIEEKLAANEFLLNEAGRIGRVGGWEFDIITKRSIWSPTVYDIYELPHDFDLDGVNMVSFFAGPYNKKLDDAIKRTYNDGTGWDLELKLNTATGLSIWVRSCGEIFYNAEGKASKLRGVFMDINRYKINEQALTKSHEMLFHSHQQLKTFTHILSHNIRNHSSNISLLTDMVDTALLDHNNSELFDKITKVAHGLNNTLNDLSEAIKIRESNLSGEILHFREIAGKVIEILEFEILSTGAEIKFNFEEETVLFPKIYLESIFINLVSNAIKYKKENAAPVILLKTYQDVNNRTVLECTDNGLGIDIGLHGSKLFGLYKTFHAHKEAHGVGLFLVKTQVESQGGIISVESTPGSATTFKILF